MPLNYYGMGADFHLLKRENSKGKTIYYAAFLSDLPSKNGKKNRTSHRRIAQGGLSWVLAVVEGFGSPKPK